MRLNRIAIYYFLLPFLNCFATSTSIFHLQHLPSAKKFIFADSLNYEKNEYERENVEPRSDLKQSNYFNNLSVGYSIDDSYFLSINESFYIKNSYKRDHSISQNSYSKFSDPKITIIKRLHRNNQLEPQLDLVFSITPYTGDFKRSNNDSENNMKNGGTDLGWGFRFGIRDHTFDSMTTFFLNYHGKRRGETYENQLIKYGPYSSYGIKIDCQYLMTSSWSIGGGAKIQRESSLSLKDEYTEHEGQDGYSASIQGTLTFIANKDFITFVTFSSSSTGIIGGFEDLEKETTKFSAGVIFQ